jgi:hypothetical protein
MKNLPVRTGWPIKASEALRRVGLVPHGLLGMRLKEIKQ